MKKSSHVIAYFTGVLTALILCISITTVLAKNGAISYNAISFSVNEKQVAAKGEYATSTAGTKIPSSILFADELGYGTTYVPIRLIADTLQLPLEWDSAQNAAKLRVTGDLRIPLLPLNRIGVKVDFFTEIAPSQNLSGAEILKPVTHQAFKPYEKDLSIDWSKGDCVSVTVTNTNDKPVIFGLGRLLKGGTANVQLNSQVPAGQTITRTFKIDEYHAKAVEPIYIVIGNSDQSAAAVSVTVTAVQSKS